jgi:agmatinase
MARNAPSLTDATGRVRHTVHHTADLRFSMKSRQSDHAFTGESLYGTQYEHMYSGALSFLRRRYTRDLEGVDVAVTGIPFDLATSNRPGTRFGPAGIRAASAQLSWGPPWPWGFDPTDRLAVIDYGDCMFDYGRPEGIPSEIEAHAEAIIARGVSLLCLGGDHFVTLPLLRAHAKRHGPLALIHFDAHSDTWKDEVARTDHGTMFFHATREGIVVPERSVQIGIRTHNSDPMGFTWLDAAWVHENGVDAAIAETVRIVGDHPAYLTFDIDCLDPSYAPGTGTPVVGGLSTFQAQSIIRGLGRINLVAMDIVEVAPAYDHADITSLAAASLALDYLCLRAHKLPAKIDASRK